MFGKRLAALRKQKGISQYKLAEDLGLSRGQLANYETRDREPDFETLAKIATYFNVSADYLLGLTENIGQPQESEPIEDMADWMEIRDLSTKAGLTVGHVKQILVTHIEILRSLMNGNN